MDVTQFLSAFGLGAVVAAVAQAFLLNRSELAKRDFNEKKESYVGFLDALHKSEVESTVPASLNAGHWQNRIELVGSTEVIRACLRIRETNPTDTGIHPERPQAMVDLKAAMRRDLAVAKN